MLIGIISIDTFMILLFQMELLKDTIYLKVKALRGDEYLLKLGISV